MSNLPENTSYQTQNTGALNIPAGIKLGFGSGDSNQYSATPDYISDAIQNLRPVRAKAPVISAKKGAQTEAIPTDYSGFWGAGSAVGNPEYSWVKPSDQAVFRDVPEGDLGGGQYVIDPSKPDQLIHSNRYYGGNEANDYDSWEKKRVLNGLPSSDFQVDHIVPLWAGGANTLENKQNLYITDHENKTAAQAVPYTLYSAGKIDLNEARKWSMQWKTLPIGDIDTPDPVGKVSLANAEKVYSQWKDNEIAKPNVGIMDVLHEIPESAKKFGEGWLPSVVREFGKGLVSGATANLVPYQLDDYTDSTDKVLGQIGGIAGNITGTVVGFGKFVQLAKWARLAALGTPLEMLAKFAPETASAGKKLFGLENIVKDVEPAVTKLPWLGGEKIPVGIRGASSSMKLTSALKSAGWFSAYGQASLFAQGLTTGREATFKEHVGQFFKDFAMGGITGPGVVSPTWKGAIKVAAPSMMIGLMSGDSITDALVNTGVMVGLHQMGKSTAKNMSDRINVSVNDMATKTALDTLNIYAPKEVPVTPEGKGTAEPVAYTEEQANDIATKALDSMNKLAKARGWDEEDIARERARIITSAKQLWYGGMAEPVRTKKQMEDLSSLANTVKQKTDGQTWTNPEGLNHVVANRPTNFDTSKYTPEQVAPYQDPKYPSGRIPLTGYASQIDAGKTADNVRRFSAAQGNGSAGNRVYLVDRPEMEPFIRSINSKYTQSDIDNLVHSPSKNPQNNVQAFGVIDGANGKEVVPLGWASREFRIDQSKNAWNKNEFVNAGGPKYDPNYNKDTIANGMRNNGVRILPAETEKVTPYTKHGEPFISLKINPHNWMEADMVNKSYNTNAGEPTETLMKRFKTSKSKTERAQIANKVAADLKATPEEMIDSVDIPEIAPAKEATKTIVNTFADAVSTSNTPEEVASKINEVYGPIVDQPTAENLIRNKSNLIVKDPLDIVYNAIKSGNAKPGAKIVYGMSMDLFSNPDVKKSGMSDLLVNTPLIPKGSLRTTPMTSEVPNTPINAVKPVTEAPVAANETPTVETPAPETPNPIQNEVQNTVKKSIIKKATAPVKEMTADRTEYKRLSDIADSMVKRATNEGRSLTNDEMSQIKIVDKQMADLIKKNKNPVFVKGTNPQKSIKESMMDSAVEIGKNAIGEYKASENNMKSPEALKEALTKVAESSMPQNAGKNSIPSNEYRKVSKDYMDKMSQHIDEVVNEAFRGNLGLDNTLYTPNKDNPLQKFEKRYGVDVGKDGSASFTDDFRLNKQDVGNQTPEEYYGESFTKALKSAQDRSASLETDKLTPDKELANKYGLKLNDSGYLDFDRAGKANFSDEFKKDNNIKTETPESYWGSVFTKDLAATKSLKTAEGKEFRQQIEGMAKSQHPYGSGFGNMLKTGIDEIFVKKQPEFSQKRMGGSAGNSYALNSMFKSSNPYSYLRNLLRGTNAQGHPISQRFERIEAMVNNDTKKLASLDEETRAMRAKEEEDRLNRAATSDSESTTEGKDASSASENFTPEEATTFGYSAKDTNQLENTVTDLTNLENKMPGLLKEMHTGEPATKEQGIMDATRLLKDILSKYNAGKEKDKRIRITPDEWNKLTSSVIKRAKGPESASK